MAIQWGKIVGFEPALANLKGMFPEVAEWNEAAIAAHIPKAWKKVASISVGAPTSSEYERTQHASIFQLGFMLFYRSGDKEYGPVAADFPSTILSYHPGWQDCDKKGIMHIQYHGWDSDVDILDAIRDVTPPWNYFSLNGEFLELDLGGEIKPYDENSSSDY